MNIAFVKCRAGRALDWRRKNRVRVRSSEADFGGDRIPR
jgi:hypothetical protein